MVHALLQSDDMRSSFCGVALAFSMQFAIKGTGISWGWRISGLRISHFLALGLIFLPSLSLIVFDVADSLEPSALRRRPSSRAFRTGISLPGRIPLAPISLSHLFF